MFHSRSPLLSGPRVRPYAVLFGTLLGAAPALAQVPTQCLEIESILVDACNSGCQGATEGENEMVRFITGPDPIAIADLSVTWPNNGFQGLVQNATTASLVDQLNATIESCGYLLEPPAGVIPPGHQVLLITSTAMCTASNSFANLSDTLYVIFQNAGNTSGHFANQNNGSTISPVPTGASSLRQLIITYLPTGCADTVAYDRSLLVNINGTYGGSSTDNDGATANFSWPGTPEVTYTNTGCQAPFVPVTVAITSGGGNVNCGGTTTLVGEVSGSPASIVWTGGSGTFSDPTALTTDYTLAGGESGTVTLTLNAITACGDTVRAAVEVNVIGTVTPVITASGPTTFCTGGSVTLTASGADSYLWSTNDPTSSITVTEGGTYTVTGTATCGTGTATITVTVDDGLPTATITGPTQICVGGFTVLTASGGGTYLWSTSEPTASITVGTAGVYSVDVTNACGTASASVTVTSITPTASIAASPLSGGAPLTVDFTGTSSPNATTWSWYFDDTQMGSGQAVTHTFTEPGVYNVSLTATVNGCTSAADITITVVEEEPSTVTVPNVFSPNHDGKNDTFRVISTGLRSLSVLFFNRWGQQVASVSSVDQGWDGRSDAGEQLSDGTYFYVLKADGFDGKHYDLHGAVTMLR